jgi:hypothetical protein
MSGNTSALDKVSAERQDAIVIKIDEKALDECSALMRQVTGEATPAQQDIEQRFDDLVRLSRSIGVLHGYVPIHSDENRFPASGTGISWICPIPSDALREHCAAIKAGQVYRSVEEIRHRP